MSSECVKFSGRLRDLCEGRGLDGRPDPPVRAIVKFRNQNGLTPLPEPPRSGGPPPSPPNTEMPRWWVRGLNLGCALLRHVTNGLQRRTDAEVEAILDICQGCEFKIGDGQNFNCGKCGCQCAANNDIFLNKLAWKSEQCPIGKWV